MSHNAYTVTIVNSTAKPSQADTLSKIQNVLENLGGSQYFSIHDQGKAYHQIHLSPEIRHLTAFTNPWGFYEWVRVPFRLMNAPTVFQRFMEQSFQDCRDHFVVPYLDDLFVFSSDLKHLQLTLQRLRKYGMKIKAKISVIQRVGAVYRQGFLRQVITG